MSRKKKVWLTSSLSIIIICFILYKPFINYLTSQAVNPEGWLGNVITRIWSTYFTNLNQWTLEKVNLQEDDILLDVGFGGGSSIKVIKEISSNVKIYGIDISNSALQTATNANQKYIDEGNVFLEIGDVMQMRFEDDYFDIIMTTQTHIYWESLNQGLMECYRVLKEGGTFIISCEIDKIEYHLPTYKNHDSFKELLEFIGFTNVTIVQEGNYVAFMCTK